MGKSKEADSVLKKAKVFESKCMNNEVTIEEYDKNLRQTTKMASDNEQKLDELTRKLGVQEDELRRALERAVRREQAEEHRGGAPDRGREHEAAGEVCREGRGEGGEAEGQNPPDPAEVQGGRGQVRVRRDEHHQAQPED